uniref:Uncharacterized protein n=1 Tax=Anguilla anguilla TaxID=7936 RepID=A0A0E9SB54_ANGAN
MHSHRLHPPSAALSRRCTYYNH